MKEEFPKSMKEHAPSNYRTKMSDELLGDVHPFKQLLEETIGETLLNRGNVLLHVLQAPEGGDRRREWTHRQGEGWGTPAVRTSSPPSHSVSIELEELEQVLGLLPVSGLLLRSQGVIRHEQRVGATA